MSPDPSPPVAEDAETTAARPTTDTGRAPAAIIWLSGLGAQKVEQDLEEITRRIAFACDRKAAAEATFAVRSAIQPENVGSGPRVSRCTILHQPALRRSWISTPCR